MDTSFCSGTGPSGVENAPLHCDLKPGHDGERHEETYVATWLRDGSDVRWFNSATNRYEARED